MSVVYLLGYAVATAVVLWSLGGLMTAHRAKSKSNPTGTAQSEMRSAA